MIEGPIATEKRLRSVLADQFEGVPRNALLTALLSITAEMAISDGASKRATVDAFEWFVDLAKGDASHDGKK